MFPKEFHLATLTKILEAAAKLHVDVNVKEIVVSVMDTLVRYVEQSESMDLKSADLFNVFWDAVTKMIIVSVAIEFWYIHSHACLLDEGNDAFGRKDFLAA